MPNGDEHYPNPTPDPLDLDAIVEAGQLRVQVRWLMDYKDRLYEQLQALRDRNAELENENTMLRSKFVDQELTKG